MRNNNLKGTLILAVVTVIWGLAFVAQNHLAEFVPPFTFNALRSFIAAAFLLSFRAITNIRKKEPFFPKDKAGRKRYYLATAICGALIAISANFQQFGIALYPEGAAVEARSGFITALYVIMVPVISMFFRKRVHPVVWLGVVIAIAGTYMLCLGDGFSGIYLGDIMIFACALSFAFHIISVDRFGAEIGGVKLCILQFLVCGVVSAILALIFETVTIDGIITAAPQILYLGIMSSGVAYTLQIVGQRYAEPTVASITMSFESVVAAVGGWFLSGNALTPRELAGCALVFIAIIVSQLPGLFRKRETTA